MATPRNSNFTVFTAVQGTGATETINSQSVKVYLADTNGDILLATGTVTITDGSTGYAKGGIYLKTDVATGTGGTYFNKGTNTSSAFTLATQA
jgi:hypothetical protein